MLNHQPDAAPKQSIDAMENDQGQAAFKNQNPNQNHNTKKVSLGPNTKR